MAEECGREVKQCAVEALIRTPPKSHLTPFFLSLCSPMYDMEIMLAHCVMGLL